MYKTQFIPLTMSEELTVAVMHLNIEKFKYLLNQKYFKPGYLATRTADFNNFHLYAINQAYRYITTLQEYRQFHEMNERFLDVWEEKFNMPREEDGFLMNYFKHKHGIDYSADVTQIEDIENHIKLVEDLNFWRRTCDYLLEKESYPNSIYKMDYVILLALIIRMHGLVDKAGIHADVDIQNIIDSRKEKKSLEQISQLYLPKEAKDFIDRHDNPGEILALFDEDKSIYGLMPQDVKGGVCKYLCETKHLKIRVGGNSFRIGRYLSSMAESLGCIDKLIDMDEYVSKHQFKWNEPLIQYADHYDFRSQGDTSMVWFYVNNVECGYYNEDGTFQNFNSNEKGAWQIAEVIKVKGYNDIPPATCALTCGRDKRISGKQEILCHETDVDFINLLPCCIDRIR